jgi:hypothetical protein
MGTTGSDLSTELAIGNDGTIYVSEEGIDTEKVRNRPRFVGWALRVTEVRKIAREHTIAKCSGIVLASDGRFYANADWLPEQRQARRRMFAGYAMTRKESEFAVHEIHRLAFNVTIQVQDAVRELRLSSHRQRSAARERHSGAVVQ